METHLYSVSLHHSWDLQLKPGLPLLNVWVHECVCACVCVCVCVVTADLHISFASHKKFIFNSANCQSSIKVCVTASWLFALIRNRTLSTMVCVYMCACIVMIPPMGGMVLILVFTLYKYFRCFFWQRSFFNYLRTEKISLYIADLPSLYRHTLAWLLLWPTNCILLSHWNMYIPLHHVYSR